MLRELRWLDFQRIEIEYEEDGRETRLLAAEQNGAMTRWRQAHWLRR